MKVRALLTIAVVAIVTYAPRARAQTTVNATATITIPQVLFISVDETNITFPQPGSTEFDAGLIGANEASTVTHKGNIVHDVELKADAANFTALDDPVNNIKAAADFQWSNDGGTNFTSISTTAADVVTAAPKGIGNQTVNYRILLDYLTDAEDTYTLGFTFTIVAN